MIITLDHMILNISALFLLHVYCIGKTGVLACSLLPVHFGEARTAIKYSGKMAEKHGTGGKAMVNLAKRAKRVQEKVCLLVHVSLVGSTFPASSKEVWI